MDLCWKHLHRRMADNLKQKLEALKCFFATPRQTLAIIRTAIIPSLAYASPVPPCSPAELHKWDTLIGMTTKNKFRLWRSTPDAMVREDIHCFGLGSPSIHVEYHRPLAVALAYSLVDPSCRHKLVTSCLLSHQINHLKTLRNNLIQAGTSTALHIKRQIQSHIRARQLLCIHDSKLHLIMKDSSLHLSDLKFISETTAARTPPPPNLNTLITCIIKPLRTLGIPGFHDLRATNEQFLLSGNQLKQKFPKVCKKHIIAINRFVVIVNLPSTEDLTAGTISSILNRKEPLYHTLSCTRKTQQRHSLRDIGL